MTNILTTAQDNLIPREEYSAYYSETLKHIDNCDIYSPASVSETYQRGPTNISAQFICLHGSKFEFPRSIYNSYSQDDMIDRSQFTSLVESAIRGDKRFFSYINWETNFVNTLGILIYELFQNTNDHAYENLSGNSFNKNIRAFILKSHSDLRENKNLFSMASENRQFNEYLTHCTQRFRERNLRLDRFIEISVIDGGLGFAQQFTEKPISSLSPEQERRITIDCFKKGVSSKRFESRGGGLDNVWKGLCKLDGFIRLRTGRICLFQTFMDREPDRGIDFFNWSNEPLEQVEGSAITIVIPCYF